MIYPNIQKLALFYSSSLFNFSSYCFTISDREREERVNRDFMQVGQKSEIIEPRTFFTLMLAKMEGCLQDLTLLRGKNHTSIQL